MTFPTYTFLLFWLAAFAWWRSPLSFSVRKRGLLAASYFFYGVWNPSFVLLLAASTVLDFAAASRLHRSQSAPARRAWLAVSLVFNLGMLAVFKYGGFLSASADALFSSQWSTTWAAPLVALTLPVGISFYTFQTLSYTIDIYRRQLEPVNSFWDYALYVSFFPQLVAGPIVRARDFLPQLTGASTHEARSPSGPSSMNHAALGVTLFIVGLFQKVVVADALLAPVVEVVYAASGPVSTSDAWVGTLAFSGQILCDFAGYSLCAIGVALTLGFVLPDNFRAPYAAVGFSDFWRRWHITLSSWLRDYLYIPLGGSRSGAARTAMALLATMLLGGLWHGASWTFVAWGALHGAYLIVERMLRIPLQRLDASWRKRLRPVAAALTFFAVTVAWVFFRADSFARAGAIFGSLVGGADASLLAGWQVVTVLVAVSAVLLYHRSVRDVRLEARLAAMPWALRGGVLGVLLWAIAVSPGTNRAFLYFQF